MDPIFNDLFKHRTQEERRIKNRQKEKIYITGPKRKNNRKNTNSRHTQYIREQIPGIFPPKFRTKCIKHDSY